MCETQDAVDDIEEIIEMMKSGRISNLDVIEAIKRRIFLYEVQMVVDMRLEHLEREKEEDKDG